MSVSEDTKEFLEQVKKGKPRKFVLLAKGATIISLVLYKKGGAAKYIKQAKEEGSGQPYFGVATGKGMDINFQLATEDGFDKAPVKDLVLKNFLDEQAAFKCKPMFEIVQTRPTALDSDDTLHARFLNLQTAIQAACDAFPDQVAQIGTLCKQISGLLDEDQRDSATAKLEELEKLLDGLKPAATPGTPNAAVDSQQTAFQTLRAKLEPLLLAAQKAAPDKALALGNIWNYADSQAESSAFANALKALTGLAETLKKILAAASSTATDPTASDSAGTLVMLQKSRLEWDSTRKEVQGELQGLETAIVSQCDGHPRLAEIKTGAKNIFVMLEKLDTRLITKLDEALNAEAAEKRAQLQSDAYDIVTEYREYVDSEPLLLDIDRNGFTKTGIRTRLTRTLDNLASQLVP